MATPDMDVIKEIPGYKVILKAVLKSQIQQLVEQLAAHTDEESVILTASVSDGTLSHLGSDSGRFFLDDHEDIKSQFLGFCLKRHHKKKIQEEQQSQSAQRGPPWPPGPSHMIPGRSPRQRFGTPNRSPGYTSIRPNSNIRHEPYAIPRPRRSLDSAVDSFKPVSETDSYPVKDELDEQSKSDEGTSQSSNNRNTLSDQPFSSNNSDSSQGAFELNKDLDPDVNVKVEAISEADMELEITGVELGSNPIASQKDASLWSPDTSLGQDLLGSGATGMPGDLQGQPAYNQEKWCGQGKGRFPCELCGKHFATKQNMERHLRIHTGEKPYECPICGKTFNQKTNLRSHSVVHLKDQLD